MGNFKFSRRSIANMIGVAAPLVAVAHRALELTTVDFVVTDGLRTIAEQREHVRAGRSKTMNSRHLTGDALDVAALIDMDGDGDKEVPWNEFTWKRDDGDPWDQIAYAFKKAADELGVPIEWGGDWKTFADAPHFQLPRGYNAAGWTKPVTPADVSDQIEQAKAATLDKAKGAPRVTPDDLEAEVVDTAFHVFPGTTLTVCALTLKNGFVVTGESAAASPENFDATLGERIARQNAVNKIWPLLGFRLRDQLAG